MNNVAKFPAQIAPFRRQGGFALIVVIMLLFVVTSVAMLAFNTSDTGTKIAGNSLDKSQAFYAAEAGVIEAMSYIKANKSFTSGNLPEKTLPNRAKFSVTWDSLRAADNTILLVSTGDAINPGAQTVIETRIEITSTDLDNAVTIPNFSNTNASELDDEPFRTKDGNTQILGKVWVGAFPGDNNLQVRISNTTAAKFAGAANLTIGGTEYNVKVNNPTGDGTANQFTVNVGGVNYNGSVNWDDPSNPTTGTASVIIAGVTYSGSAKPGSISITGTSSNYSGPTTASGKVGFLNYSVPQQPIPSLTTPNIASLGTIGSTIAGYTPPSSDWDLQNSDYNLTIGGVSEKVYNGSTHVLDFTLIPGGILYLPKGVRFGNDGQTIYYKGAGTIVAGGNDGDDEVKIRGSLIPATGFAATSDLAIVTSGKVEIEPHNTAGTIMANIYNPGKLEGEDDNDFEAVKMEDNVNFIGTIVAGALEMEGDDDNNGVTAKITYRHPRNPLPGLAYFGANLKVAVKQGSWVEK